MVATTRNKSKRKMGPFTQKILSNIDFLNAIDNEDAFSIAIQKQLPQYSLSKNDLKSIRTEFLRLKSILKMAAHQSKPDDAKELHRWVSQKLCQNCDLNVSTACRFTVSLKKAQEMNLPGPKREAENLLIEILFAVVNAFTFENGMLFIGVCQTPNCGKIFKKLRTDRLTCSNACRAGNFRQRCHARKELVSERTTSSLIREGSKNEDL